MNKRLEKIKEKLKGTPQEEGLLAVIKNIEEKAQLDAQSTTLAKAVEKTEEIFANIHDLLKSNTNDFTSITTYLEKQYIGINKNQDATTKIVNDVIKVLAKLTKSIEANQKATPPGLKLNATQLKNAFSEALDKVENLMVAASQVPDSGSVTYDGNDNVTSIREVYTNKTVVTTFKWNSAGKMTSWTTKEI